MTEDQKLRVVLCWHMHQPEYREPLSGRYLAPWTYLHALKDYSDMATHLENCAPAAAVVNFSSVLLEQLEDYITQLEGFLAGKCSLRDPLLAALAEHEPGATPQARMEVLQACQPLQGPRMLERFAPLRRLAEFARLALAESGGGVYLSAQFCADLLVWCHLAWLGEAVRRQDMRVQRLTAQGANYSLADRRLLLEVMRDVIGGILPRYRELAKSGRVELSMSPYAHPILPLLLDFAVAREAHAQLPLPEAGRYPGGAARARWQLEGARDLHAQHFGAAPHGCWPSEGAVSSATTALLDECGFTWAASGGHVLQHSLGAARLTSELRHRPYRLGGQRTVIFFRDDELSDLIGFEYKTWHADAAVADLVKRLGVIAGEAQAGAGRVVSIVLDGENAWEHYPDNAWHFLSALYRALASDPRFCLTTFSRCVADATVPVRPLPKLIAGSWVRGDLDTWIGQTDKNRAWDMLVEASREAQTALASGKFGTEERVRIVRELAVCEGSDWFWWPGEENLPDIVVRFDELFRVQLTGLYRLIGAAPPGYLAQPFSHGQRGASGGVMRRAE